MNTDEKQIDDCFYFIKNIEIFVRRGIACCEGEERVEFYIIKDSNDD